METTQRFAPFTLTHGYTVLGIAILIAFAIAYGRKHQNARAVTRFERALAYTNIAVWIASHGYWQMPQ